MKNKPTKRDIMIVEDFVKKTTKQVMNESPWKYTDEDGKPTNYPPGYKQQLKNVAMKVAKLTGEIINKEAVKLVKTDKKFQNLYTSQGLLEEVIKILEENV